MLPHSGPFAVAPKGYQVNHIATHCHNLVSRSVPRARTKVSADVVMRCFLILVIFLVDLHIFIICSSIKGNESVVTPMFFALIGGQMTSSHTPVIADGEKDGDVQIESTPLSYR